MMNLRKEGKGERIHRLFVLLVVTPITSWFTLQGPTFSHAAPKRAEENPRSNSSTASSSIRAVSPPEGVWVTERRLFLSGVVEGASPGQVAVKGVDVEAEKGLLPVKGGAFGALISLEDGMNVIRLSAGDLEGQARVFYVPPGEVKRGEAGPKGFRRFYVHRDPAHLRCTECHVFKRGVFDFGKIVPARANCTTGKCHGDMGRAAHLHGPMGAGVCISCHSPHGAFEPLELERTGVDLCLTCHQAMKDEIEQEFVHAPLEIGCVDCHDPHESPMRFQLRGEGKTVASLCFGCHEQAMFTRSHQHGPVASGDCVACHMPHASDNPSLLIAPPSKGEVCFQCHQDRKDDFAMKFVHGPAVEDCGKCHDPHSAEAPFHLVRPGGELCRSCHENLSPGVYQAITTATYKHVPVDEGRCVACHRPHSSDYRPLLKDSMEPLCVSCHTDLGDEIAGSKFRHGPVQTGDCQVCHKVHGSPFAKLLASYFASNFYTEYRSDYYDLCFGCHNREVAEQKYTSTLTDFRDGDYNLHFYHVNMKKGRTCIACHDAHASNQPKHVRYEVPFGAWSYSIEYTITDSGGTCVVGCHAPKTYDRRNPRITPSQ